MVGLLKLLLSHKLQRTPAYDATCRTFYLRSRVAVYMKNIHVIFGMGTNPALNML